MPIAGANTSALSAVKPTFSRRIGSGLAAPATRTAPRLLRPGKGGDFARAIPSASITPESITVQTGIVSPFGPSGKSTLAKNQT